MKVLALIPARGGSKGVPRKNVLPVGGKPLIVWSIEHALAARSVTRVIVSTDDAEIAAVAQTAGAELPFMRPAEYAGDHSTDLDVFQHALGFLAERGELPELVVHLRPTGPVRDPADIDEAVRRLTAAPHYDALRSVSVATQTPYKMWRRDGDELLPVLRLAGLPEAHSMPRQLLPTVYWQNGYVDVLRPRTVLELGSMVGEHCLAFECDSPGDLDYPEQLPDLEDRLRARRFGRRSRWPARPPA